MNFWHCLFKLCVGKLEARMKNLESIFRVLVDDVAGL